MPHFPSTPEEWEQAATNLQSTLASTYQAGLMDLPITDVFPNEGQYLEPYALSKGGGTDMRHLVWAALRLMVNNQRTSGTNDSAVKAEFDAYFPPPTT